MRKILSILFLVCFLGAQASLNAAPRASNSCIYKSTFTTADATLATVKWDVLPVRYLHTVIISSASAGGVLSLWDAQDYSTTSARIGIVDMGQVNTYFYDIWLASGLCYTTSGNTNGVTMTFRK